MKIKGKKEKKREKNREKKEGIYKRGVRKEGSESEPASSKVVLCARLQAVALHFSRKTFHHLAPPNLALERLQSLAITPIYCQLCIASLVAPTHAKKRNASLTIRGFASPLRLAHAHMQRKEMYFAPPIPKHCANISCHLGPRFLHTSCVCNLAFLFTCVDMVPSAVLVCIRRRSP